MMHNSYHVIASIKELTRQIDQLKEVLEKHECNQAERHRHMVTMLEEIYDHTTESIQINEVHSSSGQPTDIFSWSFRHFIGGKKPPITPL